MGQGSSKKNKLKPDNKLQSAVVPVSHLPSAPLTTALIKHEHFLVEQCPDFERGLGNLNQLPNEVLATIASSLSPGDILALSACSKSK